MFDLIYSGVIDNVLWKGTNFWNIFDLEGHSRHKFTILLTEFERVTSGEWNVTHINPNPVINSLVTSSDHKHFN